MFLQEIHGHHQLQWQGLGCIWRQRGSRRERSKEETHQGDTQSARAINNSFCKYLPCLMGWDLPRRRQKQSCRGWSQPQAWGIVQVVPERCKHGGGGRHGELN